MYTLYFSKKDKDIKVSKAKKVMQNLKYTEEAVQFNDCYYICVNRKPLVEKAKEIQEKWISEMEEELESIKKIKV